MAEIIFSDFYRTILLCIFSELYNNLPLLECGYTKDDISTASPDDMNEYYSVEEQEKYGVVGIEVRVNRILLS